MRWIRQSRGGIEGSAGQDQRDLGTCIEARHPWIAVAVQRGQIVWQLGPDLATTWRSAAKPFQLATCLELLGDPSLQDEELAVGAASHSAELRHVRWVRAVLARFDVAESDLQCGAHPPVHGPAAEAVLRAGEQFSAIHNNCSGKHAFMVAVAARHGWPMDYRPPEHPLQQAILRQVTGWTGVTSRLGIDGCGVPTFCLPLSAIAQAWAALATAMGGHLPGDRLGPVGRAMARHPDLTSGTERLDESVVRLCQVPMAAKIGAQGLFCMALPDRQMGIAVKVLSGCSDALPTAIAATLGHVAADVWQEPPAWRFREVRNVVGHLVGLYCDAAEPGW